MKLLSGSKFKSKYLIIIISAVLLVAALAIIYILGGFRLLIGNKNLEKVDSSQETSSLDINLIEEFDKKFKTISLPFSIALNNAKFDTTSFNQINSEEAKAFLNDFEKNYYYYAVAKIIINDANNAYIILRMPHNSTFEYIYYLKIYNKNYKQRGQAKIAEFTGDRNNLNIIEAKIYEDFSVITTNYKATITNGDSIIISNALPSQKLKIKADGTISISDTSFIK